MHAQAGGTFGSARIYLQAAAEKYNATAPRALYRPGIVYLCFVRRNERDPRVTGHTLSSR